MILRVFEQIFKIQPTAQCIIYCWSFGHFTCYEMSMSRSTYIMIIKLFVCECTKDDDREVAALMSTRLWNFHIYVIVCLFVQGLDCSIASQIKSVFAEFPWHRHLVTRKMAEASTVDDAQCSGLNIKKPVQKLSKSHLFRHS